MDFLVASLRFLHILAAAAWLGAALFFVLVLNPAVLRAGADGEQMLRTLALRSRIALYMPLVAGLTILFGFAAYGAAEAWRYGDAQLRVLNGGATLGILAAVWGGVMEGRTTKAVKHAAGAGGAGVAALARRLQSQGYVSLVLLVLALGAMATFRYW
ncbi:MAG TPA: hypothetical protein VFH47_07805 [Candidatus Thermoplasmatota archaeon]|nr:hypothetical protein [Candidatus Thermoplasmatota archaeon]